MQSSVGASQAFAGGLAAVGAAGLAATGFGVKMAADLETMTQGFVTLLGSSEKANAAINMIKRDAAKTPFEMAGLINANQLLTSVTKDANRSEKFLLNIGKALTAMGKGQPELDRVIVNLQQIGAVGHASMIDIKQFAFAGIPIFDMLKTELKLSGSELDDWISEGKITFEIMEKMFNKAGNGAGRFAKAFELQGGTFNQLVSNFKDNLAITAAEIAQKTGVFDKVKKGLATIIDFMQEHQEEFINAIKAFGDFVVKNFPIIAGIIMGGLTPALIAMGIALGGILIHLAPFLLAGAAIGFLWQKNKPLLFSIAAGMVAVGTAIFIAMLPAITSAIVSFGALAIAVIAATWPFIAIGVVVAGAAYLIITNWSTIVRLITKTAPEIYRAVIGWFGQLFTRAGQIFNSLVTSITKAGQGAFNAAVRIGKNIYNGVVDFVKKIPGAVVESIKNAIKSVGDFAGKALDQAKKLGGNIWQGFKNGLGIHSPSYIEKALTNITQASKDSLGSVEKDIRKFATLGSVTNNMSNNKSIATNIHGPIYIGSEVQADSFLGRLSRNQELADKGLATVGSNYQK